MGMGMHGAVPHHKIVPTKIRIDRVMADAMMDPQ